MKYFFYIIRCRDNSLYSGITTDVMRRVKEHNSPNKSAKYTRSRSPVVLVHKEEFSSRSLASKREYEVKLWTKQKKESLLSGSAD